MQRSLIHTALFCTVLACASLQSAQAADSASFEISRPGDIAMDCHSLSRETAIMNDMIAAAQDIQDSSRMTGTGIGVAKTVGSYLVGSLGGALGILAAGYIVGEATDNSGEDAAALQDKAEKRRSFILGIYNARGCQGPVKLAEIEPAAGTSVPVSPRPRRAQFVFND